MKYAILGGSFNPVHIGHLFLADEVLTKFAYDRIILIPAFQSPLKAKAEGASPRDRLEMLAASIAGDPRMTIDDCELNREGVSYTIDTVKDIISRYQPEEKPGLILGDDLVAAFHEWRNPDEIAKLTNIIIARRLSKTGNTDSGIGAENFPYPHRTLDNEAVNIASQEVRGKIGNGGAWRYFVPSGARHIIEERGLYRLSPGEETVSGSQGKDELLETSVNIENEVRSILSFDKFIHSRNTALLSWDICRRLGLESQKGYLAGIAHDMCKPMTEKELLRLAHEDGGGFSKLEHKKPGLLHGRAAAVLVQKRYGVVSRDILEAIKYHTTGFKDMSSLAKVVYIADKIEISRTGISPVLREMSQYCDLDTLFEAVLKNTVTFLKSRQLVISYSTRKLLRAMQRKNGYEKNKS